MAERHGWGTATDKSTGGSADPNVLKLEDQNRIRLLDPAGPVKWRQHFVESPTDPDQGRSAVCPRGPDGRLSMPCPLCMKPVNSEGKQQFAVSRRFATNVWDYGSESVKVLIGGPKIFGEFDAQAKAGIDPTAADWIIIKSGSRINTDYKLVRADTTPFTAAVIGPDDLHDLDKYANPDSPERILEQLESLGIDYDALELPSFTLAEAENLQMPYGKHKGMTIEQLYANERDYLLYIYNAKRDDGNYGDPVFVAMHTVLESQGDAKPLDEVTRVERPPSAPAVTSNGSGDPAAVAAASNPDVIVLIGPDGAEQQVPLAAKAALLGAGFTEPVAPEPEPEPEPVAPAASTTLVGADGSEIDATTLPEAAVQAMLASGYSWKQATPEPPAEPSDDTIVAVDISGTNASMPYGQAKGLIAAGAAKLLGPVVTPEPAAVTPIEPDGDEVVKFKLKVIPNAIDMPWKDAKRLFLEGEGDFEGDLAGDYRALSNASLPTDAEVKQEVAAAAATDPHPPAASAGSSASAVPGASLDGEPQQDGEGKWTHPALDKGYATKGSATQALNRLKKQAEDAAPAPAVSNGNGASTAEGKAGKLEQAKTLVASAGINDFNKLMALFEEVAGKRNIADFTEPELEKLIVKLQTA